MCAAAAHVGSVCAQIIFLILPSSQSGTSRVIKGFDYLRLVRLLRVTPLLKRVISCEARPVVQPRNLVMCLRTTVTLSGTCMEDLRLLCESA